MRQFNVGSAAGSTGTWVPYSAALLVNLRRGDRLWVDVVHPPIMANNTYFGAFLLRQTA